MGPDTRRRPLGIHPASRLKKPADYAAVFAAAARWSDGPLTVFAHINALPHTRFGLSVSRRQGNAVARNRRKRILREAFRLEQAALAPGLDLVLIPRGAVAPLDRYRQALVICARKLAARLLPDQSPR